MRSRKAIGSAGDGLSDDDSRKARDLTTVIYQLLKAVVYDC